MHMLRATADMDRWTERTQVFFIAKGKVQHGAVFYVAVPTHIAANRATMSLLHYALCQTLGEAAAKQFFLPDVAVGKQGLGDFLRLLPRNMCYSKFNAVLNHFVAEAAGHTQVPTFSSYASRRFRITVVHALKLDEEK